LISERSFAGGFSSFWRDTLPNLESVVRALNSSGERINAPMQSDNSPLRRDVIAETGFRLFLLRREQAGSAKVLLPLAFKLASAALAALPARKRGTPHALSESEADEAVAVARRLILFSRGLDSGPVVAEPHFLGHGLIGECKGDLADSKTLVEVKYVDRSFRSTDYRQCLIYAGLKYFSDGATFERIGIYNPFLGVATSVGIEELIYSASGRSFVEFAAELSYALTAGELSR
jgi:hypothetical protein